MVNYIILDDLETAEDARDAAKKELESTLEELNSV